MARQTRLVRLPDGTPVWARIDTPHPGTAGADGDADRPVGSGGYDGYGDPDEAGDYGGYEDVGAADAAVAGVRRLRELITGVAASVRDAAVQAGPDEVGVEFGVDFAVRGGVLVSVLADAQTSGSLKVTLTWKDLSRRTGHREAGGHGADALPQSPVPPPTGPREPPPGATGA